MYKAFCQAKKIAINEMKEMAATKVTLPWPEAYVEDAVQFMGRISGATAWPKTLAI